MKKEFNTPTVPFTIQVFSALLFILVVVTNLHLFSDHSTNELIYQLVSNFVLMMALWQGAFLVNRWVENKYALHSHPRAHIFASFLLGYLVTLLILTLLSYTFGTFYEEDPPGTKEFFLDVFISFLVMTILLSVINLRVFFRNFADKQHREAEQKYEKYYEQLLANVVDVVLVIDVHGHLKYSSPSITSLSGYAPEELYSLQTYEWIHPDDRQRILKLVQLANTQDLEEVHFKVAAKDGTVRYVEAKITNALTNPEVDGFIATIRDITNRVQAENKLERKASTFQLLMEMSKTFLQDNFQNALKKMLSDLGHFANVERAYVYVLNKQKKHWDCLYEWRSVPGEEVESMYYEVGLSVQDTPWMIRQFEAGQIIAIERLDEIPPEGWRCRQVFELDSTKSILLLPMMLKGSVIGFIGYDTLFETKKWQEDDITTLSICTEIVSSAILRQEAEQSTKESLSLNKGIIESTAEGILVTDLQDNIIVYNEAFKEMWMLTEEMLKDRKKSIALDHAIKNVINADDIYKIISRSDEKVNEQISLIAQLKNGCVLEGISVPQRIDGKVVGRIWSNRDITDRINSEREEIEKGVAQAQFESLKNQVNPHFLFNSLNVLSSLVHIDPDLSEKFIDQLARSYRYLLEQKDNEVVPLKTEIEFVNSFAFLLKIRFEEKLKINIKLSADAMNDLIAPLTLQLLIENAVKHNTISLDQPLIIDIYNDRDQYLVIKNNLQIRVQRMPSTGVGLKNIINRYKLLTNLEPEFEISNDTYTARIPLIKK